jgi:hypothetical protein
VSPCCDFFSFFVIVYRFYNKKEYGAPKMLEEEELILKPSMVLKESSYGVLIFEL